MRGEVYGALGDIVRAKGGAGRGRPALMFEGAVLSYADLDRRSNSLANLLVARGVARGDRVAILSKNNSGYVDAILGTAKAGAALVPLNWRLSPAEIGWIIADSEPALLIVEHGLEALVSPGIAVPRLGFADDGAVAWDDPGGDARDPAIPVGPDDLAMLVYTSGTTGHPKGAMIAHRNFVRHCDLERAPDRWTAIDADEVCLQVLPLFHVGGLEMLLRPLFTGATVVLHREVDMARIIADIARHRVTMTGLVPTMLQMLLDHPDSAGADFSSVRKFLYGAAPIPLPLLRQMLGRLDCDLVGTYGMTEANGVCVMLAPRDHHDPEAARLASVGRTTFGAELRVVDAEGNDCDAGETGEILVRGSGVMAGYWRNPAATAETIDGAGWLRSGDAGYFDADGFLYVCDRVKDMICSGGENIYPAEVESALFGHPSVAEVAVIGVPDPHWGESVRAVVVARPGEDIDEGELIAWARERIAGYKAPRSVRTVDALPKNAAGKILRREVRAAALAGMGET
ncbi:AMP-binding protein [Leptolyngbya sp. 15MV]|nr:AMP-binding protein [Leptolyngbya sp. 15MV]